MLLQHLGQASSLFHQFERLGAFASQKSGHLRRDWFGEGLAFDPRQKVLRAMGKFGQLMGHVFA